MWPDLYSGSLLTPSTPQALRGLDWRGPWEKTPMDIKGRPMWESTTEGPGRTLKVTTGQLSCQNRPASGSEVIGIPVQSQSDCSSRKLSPLVSIRGAPIEGPM